jgi:dethiobiotin synthetase
MKGSPPLVQSFMVAGTERGVGKTLVTAAMVRSLRQMGVNAVAMKPVSKGRLRGDGIWDSDEMRRLAAVSAFGLPPRTLCAHWLAAADDATHGTLHRVTPSMDTIVDTFQVLSTWADTVVVEERRTSADLQASGLMAVTWPRNCGCPWSSWWA